MPLEVLMAGKAGLADLALKWLIALRIRADDSNRHISETTRGVQGHVVVSHYSPYRETEKAPFLCNFVIALSGPVPTFTNISSPRRLSYQ